MTSKEYQIALGELFYNAEDGEEIYRRARKYKKRYLEDEKKHLDDGLIFLAGCVAAFFEGFRKEEVCFYASVLLGRKFEVFERPNTSLANIRSAILQYGAEHYNDSNFPRQMCADYQKGTQGVIKKNERLFHIWLRRAANAGDALCQFSEGNDSYNAGNHKDAAEWWEKAAKQGHVQAMFNLAEYYDNRGNYPMAGYWLEIAAKKGDEQAKKELNRLFYWDQRHQMWWKKS